MSEFRAWFDIPIVKIGGRWLPVSNWIFYKWEYTGYDMKLWRGFRLMGFACEWCND